MVAEARINTDSFILGSLNWHIVKGKAKMALTTKKYIETIISELFLVETRTQITDAALKYSYGNAYHCVYVPT
jgi:hypothetical protein